MKSLIKLQRSQKFHCRIFQKQLKMIKKKDDKEKPKETHISPEES